MYTLLQEMFGSPLSPAATTVSYQSDAYQEDIEMQNEGHVAFWTDSLNYAPSPTFGDDQNFGVQINDNVPMVHRQTSVIAEENDFSAETRDDDVLLCIFNRGEKLGAAFYEVENATLYLMSDKIEINSSSLSNELLRNVVRQINPAHLVVSAGQGNEILLILRQLCGLVDSEDVNSSPEAGKTKVTE